MDRRWGIWIDVEGFGNLWSAGDLALRGLTHLTRMIFAIGTRCYPDDPDRLFAHQIGDGFYIASDFHEPSLDRCAAAAVALMRGMTAAGCVARAAIAEGDLADYSGCRPREIQAEAVRHGDSDAVSLGAGLMTLQAVMGQGLIDAVALDKRAARGALLTIAAARAERLLAGFVTRTLADAPEICAIDWAHSTSSQIDGIQARAGFGGESAATLRERLETYITLHSLGPRWTEPTMHYCGF